MLIGVQLKWYLALCLPLPLLLISLNAQAVDDVQPKGVNVSWNSPTTAFLTFRGTQGQRSSQAVWCGEVTTLGVSKTNPCVAGTLLGRFPKALDRSQRSGTGGQENLTDIMTIPVSVVRRAYQQAKRGQEPTFFYVRKFTGEGGNEYLAVVCHLTAGGAASPLALVGTKLYFAPQKNDNNKQDTKKTRLIVPQQSTLPAIVAELNYTGSGRLRGRWELRYPADLALTQQDLKTQSSLPLEQQNQQQRYTLLDSFDQYLPPTGFIRLPAPDASQLPTDLSGEYEILLRIEASHNFLGDSQSNERIATGGVAAFPLPTLTYYVGANKKKRVNLLTPIQNANVLLNEPVRFAWSNVIGAQYYRLLLRHNNEDFFSAYTSAKQRNYVLPTMLLESLQDTENPMMQWRVEALDATMQLIQKSPWQALQLIE
jgi:hypothetical protein